MKQPAKGKNLVFKPRKALENSESNSVYITKDLEKYSEYKGFIRYPNEVLPTNKASKFRTNKYREEITPIFEMGEIKNLDFSLKDLDGVKDEIDKEFDADFNLDLNVVKEIEKEPKKKQPPLILLREGNMGEIPEGTLFDVASTLDEELEEHEEWGETDEPAVLTEIVEPIETKESNRGIEFNDFINLDEPKENVNPLGLATPKKEKAKPKGKISRMKPPKPKVENSLIVWFKKLFDKNKSPKAPKPLRAPKPTNPKGVKPPTKGEKPKGMKPPKKEKMMREQKNTKNPPKFGKVSVRPPVNPNKKGAERNEGDMVNSLLNSQTYRPGREIINKNEKIVGGEDDE